MNFKGQMYLMGVDICPANSQNKQYVTDVYINSEQISNISRPSSDTYKSTIRMNNGDAFMLKDYLVTDLVESKKKLDGTNEIMTP